MAPKDYTPALADDVYIVRSGSGMLGTDYTRGTITRVLKKFLEVTPRGTGKEPVKMQVNGKDKYPSDRGAWRSTWYHLEPWSQELEQKVAVARARSIIRNWTPPKRLNDEDALELAALLRKYSESTKTS